MNNNYENPNPPYVCIGDVVMTEKVKFEGVSRNKHPLRALALALREKSDVFKFFIALIILGVLWALFGMEPVNLTAIILICFLAVTLILLPICAVLVYMKPQNYMITPFAIYIYGKNRRKVLRIKFEKIVSVKLKCLQKRDDEKIGENFEIIINHMMTIAAEEGMYCRRWYESESVSRLSGIENLMEVYDYINERLEVDK